MTGTDIQQSLARVRTALELFEVSKPPGDELSEGIRDLALVVDQLRQSVWAVLTAEFAGDLAGFVGRIRVRRANALLRGVLADVYAGAVPRNMPGLTQFRDTLEELTQALTESGG
ncbi:MAG: hypothetical protein JSW71_02595 [Gemmatimonadota bacterium]|nr:MAG: hypothetical protein JSW71_02595 [Gemmatimonadota bacterium]